MESHNLQPAILAHLSEVYGHLIAPQEAFDAITALLSAATCTSRFAWDLEGAFPHVPFPAPGEVFAQAATIGANVRALEAFSRPPAMTFRSARLTGRASGPTLALPAANRVWEEDANRTGSVLLRK
jgi:hypothetical protein